MGEAANHFRQTGEGEKNRASGERKKTERDGPERRCGTDDKKIREEIRCAQEGDRNARDMLVHNNIGLVWSVVRRFINRGYEPEDLFQVGSIGLLKAIDHFDLGYDVKFSTYAVPLITGEIRRFLRDDGMVKISRTLKNYAWKVRQEEEEWRKTHNREATLEELAALTGFSKEDIVLAVSAGMEVDSLCRPVSGSEGKAVTLEEQICDEKNEIEAQINHVFLEQALASLGKEDRQLIGLRYFQGKTQTETAKILNMTQVQVSRREKKLLERMKAMI